MARYCQCAVFLRRNTDMPAADSEYDKLSEKDSEMTKWVTINGIDKISSSKRITLTNNSQRSGG